MTKTLEQIQEENRRFNGGCRGRPFNLSLVLLLLAGKEIQIKLWNYKIIVNYYFYGDCEFDWDLTRKTLEDQTEATQRAINALLMESLYEKSSKSGA